MLWKNCVSFWKYCLLILRAFDFTGKVEGGYSFSGVVTLKCPPLIVFPRMYENAVDDKKYDLCYLFAVHSLGRDLLILLDRFCVDLLISW